MFQVVRLPLERLWELGPTTLEDPLERIRVSLLHHNESASFAPWIMQVFRDFREIVFKFLAAFAKCWEDFLVRLCI